MECAFCKKQIDNGYFKVTDEGMMCVCTDCLLKYDIIRKRHKKYNCAEIYRMHEAGYSNRTIAIYFETNPLIIGKIISEMERVL